MNDNPPTHFVCLGECKGESKEPSVCNNPTCSKFGQPKTGCSCHDGSHAELKTEETPTA